MLKLRAFPSILGYLCKLQQEGAIQEQRNAAILSAGSAYSKQLRGGVVLGDKLGNPAGDCRNPNFLGRSALSHPRILSRCEQPSVYHA